MRTRSRLAAASGVLVALGLWGATPARAGAPAAMNINLSGPSSPQTASPNVTVTGHADQPSGHLSHVTAAVSGDRGQPVPAALDTDVSGSSYDLSWPVSLPYNGQYTAKLDVKGHDDSLLNNGDTFGHADRAFDVSVPPAVPTGLTVKLNDNRTVTLSWDRNREPDMVFYQVQRIRGDEAPVPLDGVAQPPPGQRPGYFDDLSGAPGGTYRYRVAAIRQAADKNQGVTSNLSGSVNVTLADPPGTTVAGGSGGGGTGSGGGSGSGGSAGSAGGSSGKLIAKSTTVDFSSFGNQLNTRNTKPTEPDGTFDPTLPYRPGKEIITKVLPGHRAAVSGGESKPVSLLMFASGLLVTAVLMHLVWLKREVDRVPLEALDAEAPEPA